MSKSFVDHTDLNGTRVKFPPPLGRRAVALLPSFLHPCAAMETLQPPWLFKSRRWYAKTGEFLCPPLCIHPPGHSVSAEAEHSPEVEGKHATAMASLRILSVIAVVAIFALADTAVANDLPDYIVQGRVYCDTCRAGFETNVTEYIKGTQGTSDLYYYYRSLNL